MNMANRPQADRRLPALADYIGTHIIDGMSPADDVRSILDSLRRLVRELRVFSRRAEQKCGLTAAQLFILKRTVKHQSLSINELAEQTLTHQSTVSVVVKRLEARGLLRRERSAKDRRRMELSITNKGRQAIIRSPRTVQDRLIEGATSLGKKKSQTLSQLLIQLLGALGASESRPALFFEDESGKPKAAKKRRASTTRKQ